MSVRILLGCLVWLAASVPTGVVSAADEGTVQALPAGKWGGQEWNGNGLEMTLCWCPPGSFEMVSLKSEPGRYHENQVSVTLTTGFWLGQHEVTQAEWKALMGTTQREKAGGSSLYGEGDAFPMYYVSHDEATAFCATLTEQERRAGRLSADWEYRLPTEAQWEYGNRAGSKDAFCFGNDESQLKDFAWHASNTADSKAHPVGTKDPNNWGLYDMHGNVWEWCRDWYSVTLSGGTDPECTKATSARVLRGGSWLDSPWICRSAYRNCLTPCFRGNGLGFRVAAIQASK